MIKHSKGIEKIIKKRISLGYNYLETLRSLYGADPREVWEIFKKYKFETKKKISLINLYPEFPEPHMAFSQWRMTLQSVERVIKKLAEKNYKEVCFLGCPVLGIKFNKKYKSSFLLDIDKTLISYAKKFTKKAMVYNIYNEILKQLKNRFECVVIDPPWYYDEIKLFIKRAAELAKVGGTIYTSLPSLLTRPPIIKERFDLQKWLSDCKLVISELSPIIEYEVPPFEYNTYLDIPAFTGEAWRKGDWMKIKKCDEAKIKLKINKPREKWLEFSYNKKRIFLKKKKENKYEKPELKTLYPDNSFILKTVSKRNSLIKLIDIWTSRNAVLKIKRGYFVIKEIISNIEKKDLEIIKIISEKYKKSPNVIKAECKDTIKKLRELVFK